MNAFVPSAGAEAGGHAVVGNDVVDLTDPAVAQHHRRERFVARVCAPDERPRVVSALSLWQLFAAKEAAYKAAMKLGFAPGFAHADFHVAADLRAVRWRDLALRLALTWDDEHVHAVAWGAPGREPLAAVTRDASAAATHEASDRARSLACGLVARAIGCGAAELAVVRDAVAGAWDGLGPPRIERSGRTIAADVSLSHDGPFAAAAVLPG